MGRDLGSGQWDLPHGLDRVCVELGRKNQSTAFAKVSMLLEGALTCVTFILATHPAEEHCS